MESSCRNVIPNHLQHHRGSQKAIRMLQMSNRATSSAVAVPAFNRGTGTTVVTAAAAVALRGQQPLLRSLHDSKIIDLSASPMILKPTAKESLHPSTTPLHTLHRLTALVSNYTSPPPSIITSGRHCHAPISSGDNPISSHRDRQSLRSEHPRRPPARCSAQPTEPVSLPDDSRSAQPSTNSTRTGESLEHSMCFSINDARVTSIVTTSDGAYCIAGFSTGVIRLFDLTCTGRADPEDRFGFPIGRLTASRHAVHLHLELSYSGDCCHLFAGVSQGSTTVLVIDIGLFRDAHRRRGFITLAGVGLKVFSHSDARLKGMTSVCAVSEGSDVLQYHGAHSSSAAVKTYAAVHRLISGKGFCSYHIWEVCLEAITSSSSSQQQQLSSGGGSLSYSSTWRHLYQGSISGPMMDFAHFVTPYHSHRAHASDAAGDGGILAVVGDFQKDLRPVCLQRSSTYDGWISGAASKSGRLKGSSLTKAASSDGMILFGGKYELVVSFYCPLVCSEPGVEDDCYHQSSSARSSNRASAVRLIGRSVFSITDFLVDATAAARPPSRRSSRHMREISYIHCTRDGSYALVHCSDNAVLLFSICDVTGKGSFPSRIEGASLYTRSTQGPALNSGGGFLSFLFTADDLYCLDLAISLAHSSEGPGQSTGPSTRCSCGIGIPTAGQHRAPGSYHHCPAEDVIVSISWWLIQDPLLGGVIKVCRLKARTGGVLSDLFAQAVPCSIAISSLVDQDDDEDIIELGGCCLCGERRLKHWNETDVTQPEKDVSTRKRTILSALDGECVSSTATTIDLAYTHAPVTEDKRAKRKEVSVGREQQQCRGHARPDAARKKKQRRRSSVPTMDSKEASSDSVGNVHVCLDEEECIGVDDEDEAAAHPPPSSTAAAAAVGMDDLRPTAPSFRHDDCADVGDDGSSAEGTGVLESADHWQSIRSDGGSTSDANKLILELDKLQAENAQLRGEIEITMRKADRRFELELVSRRAWNREREALEARIEELQSSHMLLTAELASRTRLQEALREMLSTARDA